MDKPGYKTTEFWLGLLSVVAGAVASSGIATTNPIVQGAGLVVAVLSYLGYNKGRAEVKKQSLSQAFGAKPVKK